MFWMIEGLPYSRTREFGAKAAVVQAFAGAANGDIARAVEHCPLVMLAALAFRLLLPVTYSAVRTTHPDLIFVHHLPLVSIMISL
jgi:hypothetical protein